MVTKAQAQKTATAKAVKVTAKKNSREAFLKSFSGHLGGVLIAVFGAVLSYLQNNPAAGIAGAILGTILPLVRNWYDARYAGYGETK